MKSAQTIARAAGSLYLVIAVAAAKIGTGDSRRQRPGRIDRFEQAVKQVRQDNFS